MTVNPRRVETGYCCVKCNAIHIPMSVKPFRHIFCTVCGHKLLPSAVDSYSALANLPDGEVDAVCILTIRHAIFLVASRAFAPSSSRKE